MTTTEVRQPRAVPVLLALGLLALGVGLGFALPPLARWLQTALAGTPLPVHGAIDLVAGLPWAWSVPILSGLGLVAGVLVALTAVGEALRLTVADDHLEHRTDDREGWVERADVGAVFRDGRDLVLVGAGGLPRARLDADTLRGAQVRTAFEAHRWPWRDADPWEGDYERWMDGRPGFTPAEHALLRRRHDERKDAVAVARVDAELAEHGLAARRRPDHGQDRLQVRRVGAGPGAPTPDPEGGPHGADR